MKKGNTTLWLFLFAGIVLIGVVVLASMNKRAPGQYDEFAQCLTDQGVKEYSAFWCPNCARQKELFGNSHRLIEDKECSTRGSGNNLSLCQDDGITSVPTWEFADGSRVSGTQPLEALAKRTGCALDGTFTEQDPINIFDIADVSIESSTGEVTELTGEDIE